MSTRCKTISDQLISESSLAKDVLLIITGAAFIGLLAKISIPGNPVPVSFSPQAALFVGAALGCKKGFASIVTYLMMGVAGLPVFSVGATQGFARLVGPTGGYLIGFVFAASLMGYLAEKAWDRSLWKSTLAVFLGNAIILFLGCTWLSYYLGSFSEGLNKGVIPFIGLDIVKTCVMALLLPSTWHIIKKI